MITKPPVIYGKYSLFQKIKKNSKKVLTIMDNFGKIIFADAPKNSSNKDSKGRKHKPEKSGEEP